MQKATRLVAALAASMAAIAFAEGPSGPGAEQDDCRQGYRAGYDDGFRRGYEKGMHEARAAAVQAPAPPPPITGPITVSRAVYGSSAHSCDATHWAARNANGRMSASLDVSNKICGDPSPGDRKSLDVTYVCGTIAKTATAYEHRSVYLDCSP